MLALTDYYEVNETTVICRSPIYSGCSLWPFLEASTASYSLSQSYLFWMLALTQQPPSGSRTPFRRSPIYSGCSLWRNGWTVPKAGELSQSYLFWMLALTRLASDKPIPRYRSQSYLFWMLALTQIRTMPCKKYYVAVLSILDARSDILYANLFSGFIVAVLSILDARSDQAFKKSKG